MPSPHHSLPCALLVLFAMLILPGCEAQTDFRNSQLSHDRVAAAEMTKGPVVKAKLENAGLDTADLEVLFRAVKDADTLEVWGKRRTDSVFSLVAIYPVCARSGVLGPKRRQGDMQVPEGFYVIDRFNPKSRYHLSLGVSYPNDADRKKSPHPNLGGDIFIHGDCVTIGCLPLTDSLIEEVYLMALYARAAGQEAIPVYIFPFRMDEANWETYSATYAAEPELLAFWANLRTGYQLFEQDKKQLRVSIDENGNYLFATGAFQD